MQFTEVEYSIVPLANNSEILIALLAEQGFSMFEETGHGVKAYIDSSLFREEHLKDIAIHSEGTPVVLSYRISKVKPENWNETWESNFQPVRIADQIYVRANHHPEDRSFRYNLVIQPRMAFGTGHHATTTLMMETMLNVQFKGKKVLDMGCGTGILAILASMLGADEVKAIDIDSNSTENTIDNAIGNQVQLAAVITGDARSTENEKFHVILANINRNIIIEDLPLYVNNLHETGMLITSGYYTDDLDIICSAASASGMKMESETSYDRWCCAVFVKD